MTALTAVAKAGIVLGVCSRSGADSQYRDALARFLVNPDPPGTLLNGVCRDDERYLDLTTDRLEMVPSG
jgi:hypothetical protein